MDSPNASALADRLPPPEFQEQDGQRRIEIADWSSLPDDQLLRSELREVLGAAIRGLPEQALVKITELDGRLVYQTRALGGQATWNGVDYRGKRVSSAVYLVLIKDAKGKSIRSGRIFFME